MAHTPDPIVEQRKRKSREEDAIAARKQKARSSIREAQCAEQYAFEEKLKKEVLEGSLEAQTRLVKLEEIETAIDEETQNRIWEMIDIDARDSGWKRVIVRNRQGYKISIWRNSVGGYSYTP